jgi:hypothetical protein
MTADVARAASHEDVHGTTVSEFALRLSVIFLIQSS